MKQLTAKTLVLLTILSFAQGCSSIPKHTADESDSTHEQHTDKKRSQPLGSEKRKN